MHLQAHSVGAALKNDSGVAELHPGIGGIVPHVSVLDPRLERYAALGIGAH